VISCYIGILRGCDPILNPILLLTVYSLLGYNNIILNPMELKMYIIRIKIISNLNYMLVVLW